MAEVSSTPNGLRTGRLCGAFIPASVYFYFLPLTSRTLRAGALGSNESMLKFLNLCNRLWVLKNSTFEATLCCACKWCRGVPLFFSRWREPLRLVVG